jgi:hypothetical protein
MMPDGNVHPPDFVTNAETRSSTDASSTDEVFQRFLTLCDQAGPDKCALAGHGEQPPRISAGSSLRFNRRRFRHPT